jgi:DNA-binding CsgD family transcriptional regulator
MVTSPISRRIFSRRTRALGAYDGAVSGDVDARIAAGDAALKEGQWQAAREAFEAALEQGDVPEALFGLATAVWWLGDMPGTVAALERAYAGFRQRPEPLHAAAAALRFGFHVGLHLANDAAASGWLARASRLIDEHGLEPLRGELLLTRACLTRDPVDAAEVAEQALALGRAVGDVDLELCAMGQLGASLVGQGRVSEGIALLDESMAACLGGEPRSIDTVAFTSCVAMVACARCAAFERAAQWVRATERFAERHGSPFHNVECRVVHGNLLLATGDWAQAEETLRTAIELSGDTLPTHRAEALASLADLRLMQGRLEESERLLAGLELSRRGAPVLARLRLLQGRPALAASVAGRRLESAGGDSLEGGPLLEILGEAEIALGNVERAGERGRGLAELGARLGCPILSARGGRLHGRALVLAGTAEGRRHLDAALAAFVELRLPYEVARTHLLLGEALREVEPALAETEARSALGTFEALGAAADADASAALLRRLGVRSARGSARSNGFDALTRREQEVLALLGEGLSNPQIAGRLCVSRKTVENHVAHILEKLGLKSRAEAGVHAVRRSFGEPGNQ